MVFLNKRTNELSEIEKSILLDIYIEVFAAPPRKEIINRDQIFSEMFSANHFITLAIEDNNIIGFIFSTDISFFDDDQVIYDKRESACYISSFAMLEYTRGAGSGKLLLQEHLNYLKESFDVIYSRSRVDVANIVAIFLKFGFVITQTYSVVTNSDRSLKNIYRRMLS